MSKKANKYAGLEAMPADVIDRAIQGLRQRGEPLVGKLDPPRGMESWTETVRHLEIAGHIFHGPYRRISFLGTIEPFKPHPEPQDFTIAEILYQAQLETMQARQDLTTAARKAGLERSDLYRLRRILHQEPHLHVADLIGKLEALFKNMEGRSNED